MRIRNRKPKRTKGEDKTLQGPRSRYQGHPIHGKMTAIEVNLVYLLP